MRTIHQFVAGYSNGDAISNEARELRVLFRGWGVRSEIYSEPRRILPALRGDAFDAADCAAAVGPDDFVLLHLSIGSPVNDLFAALPCRKAVRYHNITPPSYYSALQPFMAESLARGREQARLLAGKVDVAMAVSAFNARELEQMGYRDVRVLPLVLDLDRLRGETDGGILQRFADGRPNVLFVGRCVPNKRLEDLLAAFHYFQRYYACEARLIHVGSYSGMEPYYLALRRFARTLELRNVVFAGAVPERELNAYYRCADLFLCMSEHEGFCIPLMESMVHDLPVLAYAAGAVPETLDGAGILLRRKEYDLIAALMHAVLADARLRGALIERQRRRVAVYEGRDLAGELRALLDGYL
ncbi:MAG: glycosyltransferase family 4 protein [Kiritimatiellae bacterium]|nr:glycosyltransferase family 4 protein [Kiritimatiellia bacterium]